MGVRIIAEGAPILNPSLKDFLKKALGNELAGWSVTCRGGVSQTIEAFILALQDNLDGKTNDTLVLLVDSDEYIDLAVDRAAHLLQHKSLANGFDRLKKRMAEYNHEGWQVYFMVQEMEAWFLASLPQVAQYFQEMGIIVTGEISVENIEHTHKPSLKLKTMTGNKYDKTGHVSIFTRLDPNEVANLPHFRLLLEHLKSLL